MHVTPVTRTLLAVEVVELVADRPGRVRVAVDGPPPTDPVGLARAAAEELRARGRAALVVDAGDFLRPASLRLEFGHTDPDMFLDGWLDVDALRREVLLPTGPGGNGRVLPRLWDAVADRAFREPRVELPADGVLLLTGGLLLGRGLPLDVVVHLRMAATALARRIDGAQRWTLPAYARYEEENNPAAGADLLVLADHPERPAVRR